VSRDAVNIRFAPETELRLPAAQLKALARLVAAELAAQRAGPGKTIAEAQEYIGCSDDFWREHVAPEVLIVRRGRRKIVLTGDLDRWMLDNAERLAEVLGENHNGRRDT
jgi:hypothetical protein